MLLRLPALLRPPVPASDFDNIDLLMPDLNGICRGKRIPGAMADKAFSAGVLLPRSAYASNVTGDTVDRTGYGIASGDQDYLCRPEPDTLRPVPWASGNGQCLMEMFDNDTPIQASPRHHLRQLVERLRQLDLHPTVAVELEFYLFQNGLDQTGMPRMLINPVTGQPEQSTQVYSMDDLESYRPFIETVQAFSQAQSVPASAAIAEYAPGQFEINLHHQPDPVAACDDAIYLKRIIRRAAREHDINATFMAKPRSDLAGSGMHIHVSLYDANGNNRLLDERTMQHAIGGLQATMADAMLLWAPHANSFRRYVEGFYVPLAPSWGYNNRSVALRVPAGPDQARRIEHRLAGADANPYLVVAGILAGLLHGVEQCLSADQPIDGDAAKQCEPSLPTDWREAIGRYAASGWVSEYFGADFQSLMATIKQDEYANFQSQISPLDVQWYLQTV